MSEVEKKERLPYESPAIITETLRFVTPLGGSGTGGVIFSGPFRDAPPDENESSGQG
ncbi:MAG: hypothetical protein P1V51_14580 [Deltaproteobacteria bacterium]|nr:hypothetical protein [Deltaproteobacteria bacterium]